MRLYEQVYTSAAELLDPSAGHLGVVAQTRVFPKAVEAELASHRSYSLLDTGGASPARYVFGGSATSSQHIVISRIAFGGADHTGRTTPFAHHIVVERDSTAKPQFALADLVRAAEPMLHREWREPPHWIDPPRELSLEHQDLCSALSPAWDSLVSSQLPSVVSSVADVLVGFGETRRPVLLCVPLEMADYAITLTTDCLGLVPLSIQSTCLCVTHIVETSDYVRDAALLVTYPGTPFLEHCRQRHDPRRPIIFDLARPETLPIEQLGPYATVVAEEIRRGGMAAAIQAALDWDNLGLTAKDRSAFYRAIEFRKCLRKVTSVDTFSELAGKFAQLNDTSPLCQAAEQWCVEHLRGPATCLEPSDSPTHWQALGRIACDTRWTDAIRATALDYVVRNPEEVIPILVRALEANPAGAAKSRRELALRARRNPDIALACLHTAARQPTPFSVQLTSEVIDASSPSFDMSMAWLQVLADGPEELREPLAPKISKHLIRGIQSPEHLSSLYAFALARAQHTPYCVHVVQQVLRRCFASANGPDEKKLIATHLMQLAMATEDDRAPSDELRWLVAAGFVPDRQAVEEWIKKTRSATTREALQAAERELYPTSRSRPCEDVRIECDLRRRPRRWFHCRVPALPRWLIWLFVTLSALPPVVSVALMRGQAWNGHPRLQAMIYIAVAGLVGWLTSAVVNRVYTKSGKPSEAVFVVRYIVTVFVGLLMVAQAWLVVWPAVPDIINWVRYEWQWVSNQIHQFLL